MKVDSVNVFRRGLARRGGPRPFVLPPAGSSLPRPPVSKFEYLSVLVSIVIGLGISSLLSGAARLIQLRHRARMYLPTLVWMGILFLANVQIWWVAFDRRDVEEWNFFLFLLYLLIPIGAVVLSYLVLPDLGDEDQVDLKASYFENRSWFFGIFAALPVVSLVEEWVHDGRVPWDVDAAFRVVFSATALLAARSRSETFHAVNAALAAALFLAYVALLFLRLA